MKQSGIYALWYEEQDLVYIGQSVDIHRRYTEHLSSLHKSKHSNYRVQEAFNLYGPPELVILELASYSELNKLEIQWTKEFDSLNSLNIVEAGKVGHGVNSNHSVYTKAQLLLTFRLLYNTTLEYNKIADITKVNISTIKAIVSKAKHTWITNKYPYLHKKILGKRNHNKGSQFSLKTGTYLVFTDPEGREYNVYNVGQFAKRYGLHQPTLMYLVKGTREHHKGWKFLKAAAYSTPTSSIGETKKVY